MIYNNTKSRKTCLDFKNREICRLLFAASCAYKSAFVPRNIWVPLSNCQSVASAWVCAGPMRLRHRCHFKALHSWNSGLNKWIDICNGARWHLQKRTFCNVFSPSWKVIYQCCKKAKKKKKAQCEIEEASMHEITGVAKYCCFSNVLCILLPFLLMYPLKL